MTFDRFNLHLLIMSILFYSRTVVFGYLCIYAEGWHYKPIFLTIRKDDPVEIESCRCFDKNIHSRIPKAIYVSTFADKKHLLILLAMIVCNKIKREDLRNM
jgi:hypothetical protein